MLRAERGTTESNPLEPLAVSTKVRRFGLTVMADRERQQGRIALALQGGGSFGAFTWGVLDRLLEDGAEFDAISGASTGSMNAVLLASGLQTGGPDGARAALDGFWHDVADTPSLPSVALTAPAASAPFVSPYYHNPVGLSARARRGKRRSVPIP